MPKPNWPDLKIGKGLGNGAGSIIYRAVSNQDGKLYGCKHVTRTSIDHIHQSRQNASRSQGPTKQKLHKSLYQSYFDQVKNEYKVLKEFQQAGGSPHVVTVYDLRTIRKAFRVHGYDMLMDFVDGFGLKEKNDYSMRQLLDFFRQATQALVEIHQYGIIHADMKPSHVMIEPNGLVKIIDFGQSVYIGADKFRIQGTPEYMAPEQLKGDQIDFKTDVYGIGATMYWALTGRLNRPAMTGVPGAQGLDFTVSYAGRSRAVRNDNPQVPKELDELVVACCERKPEKRPQTMREVWQAIREMQKKNVVPEGL
ncbi:MAG: serine/threonine-protein kinase [Planctomycetota bacterium]|nr:serine/threonine-protein kinase [Planctomycetota bacterium]MDA1140444.1 serine/threonine-protein kinase [Planctomycetota bacterium]